MNGATAYSFTSGAVPAIPSPTPVTIGADPYVTSRWSGDIAQVATFGYALSPSQVADLDHGGTATMLPAAATELFGTPGTTCDASSTCALASDQISAPVLLPAAPAAPAAVSIFDAKAATGMGDQTVTLPWQMAVPANTYAETYASTWTFTLASGP